MGVDFSKRVKDSELERVGRLSSVAGVGPDADIVTNENGAMQSKVGYRLDLVPADAIFRMGETLKAGAERYAEWNWTGIPTVDHINHALIHLYAFLVGDTQDDHLGHAITRIAFAIHTDAHGTGA